MMKRKFVSLFMALLLTLSVLPGCGSKESKADASIELVEPVGVSASYYVADRRDLIQAKVVSGKVVPKVSESTFETDQWFESYGALPGSEVKAGDTLLYASTEAIDKQIKDLGDRIKSNQESFDEFVTEINKSITEAEADEKYYKEVVGNFERMNDSEKASYPGRGYDTEYADYKSRLAKTTASLQRMRENLKQRTELFALDKDYDNKSLKRLKAKRSNVLATANISGTVVAVQEYEGGQYINAGTKVAGVGDFSNLEVKTDEVHKSDFKRAVDAYAIVNGERFEITYKELTGEEKEFASSQASSYTTFLLDDPEGKVKAGDFVTVVIISTRKEDVLCVPKEAVNTDTDGSFVYLYDGENTYYTPITTGMTSGFYTEVVSGISEGDKVITDFTIKPGSKTATIGKGTVNTGFSEPGYLFYSKNGWIDNPVEYGTAYLKELTVKRYQRVNKGDTIAKIYVIPDDINLRRQERTLLRAQEDLAELEKDNEDDKNAKQITAKKESIEEQKKVIAKIKSDAALAEIKAPYDGVITALNWLEEGDILMKDMTIALIAAEENCFVEVEDLAGNLSCGDTVSIEYRDAAGADRVAEGAVVTVAPCALSAGLTTGNALIRVSSEDLEQMAGQNSGYDGWWVRAHFNVKAKIRSMSNVVVVPKGAVTLEGGIYYVRVKEADGKVTYRSFISGGADNENYWVVEGLSEGTTICLE